MYTIAKHFGSENVTVNCHNMWKPFTKQCAYMLEDDYVSFTIASYIISDFRLGLVDKLSGNAELDENDTVILVFRGCVGNFEFGCNGYAIEFEDMVKMILDVSKRTSHVIVILGFNHAEEFSNYVETVDWENVTLVYSKDDGDTVFLDMIKCFEQSILTINDETVIVGNRSVYGNFLNDICILDRSKPSDDEINVVLFAVKCIAYYDVLCLMDSNLDSRNIEDLIMQYDLQFTLLHQQKMLEKFYKKSLRWAQIGGKKQYY